MRISKNLYSAILDYYYNCSRQFNVKYSNDIKGWIAERTNFKWNKDEDLNRIGSILKKNKQFVNFQAIAGSFWISYKTRRGHIKTVTTNESLFPKFEVSKFK